jgi:8-oxo-dGTP pyrophosphatase MutT (NUDIX family)
MNDNNEWKICGPKGKVVPNFKKWIGMVKQSVFVFLFHPTKKIVYGVINIRDELGVPGGKRDPEDKSIWVAMNREFKEETGAILPSGSYSYFEWGDAFHSIRIYYHILSEEQVDELPIGVSPDPMKQEVEIKWLPYNDDEMPNFRYHLRKAFNMYKRCK